MTSNKLEWQRKQRLKDNNLYTKRYEKTKSGFLMRTYRNMLSRVSGVTKNKNHLYLGKEILPKANFYHWSKCNEDFNKLFLNWGSSNYNRKLTPSIDRINPDIGYIFGNIRWITFSENCKSTRRNYGKK